MGDFFSLASIKLRVDAKEINDSGIDTSLSSGAKTITFNKTFASISSILVTPKPTSGGQYYVCVVFDETAPDPTDFDMFIYNSSGTQVAIPFSWNAIGIQGV